MHDILLSHLHWAVAFGLHIGPGLPSSLLCWSARSPWSSLLPDLLSAFWVFTSSGPLVSLLGVHCSRTSPLVSLLGLHCFRTSCRLSGSTLLSDLLSAFWTFTAPRTSDRTITLAKTSDSSWYYRSLSPVFFISSRSQDDVSCSLKCPIVFSQCQQSLAHCLDVVNSRCLHSNAILILYSWSFERVPVQLMCATIYILTVQHKY